MQEFLACYDTEEEHPHKVQTIHKALSKLNFGPLPETLLSLGDSSCTTIQEERELAEKHIKVWEHQTTTTNDLVIMGDRVGKQK